MTSPPAVASQPALTSTFLALDTRISNPQLLNDADAGQHPSASIVIPTRARPDYLRVALASIAPQAARAGAEMIVVDDAGPSEQIRKLSKRFGARYEPHPRPLGLNVARNTGVAHTTGELVVFVDDDVEAREGWLGALLDAARAYPQVEVLAGRIVARLEGTPPHSCGREGPPITALDLGPVDTDARYAWGANMAISRRALERIGTFDVSLEDGGDEQEWQERLLAERPPVGSTNGIEATSERERGRILYVAGATLEHRRSPADARLLPLCRAARARGRAARRFDVWRTHAARRESQTNERTDGWTDGPVPSLARELRTLAGCTGHVVRRRCPAGLVMVAHSVGRVEEALRGALVRGTSNERPEDFLSGESGTVGGLGAARAQALDRCEDVLHAASTRRLRLDRAARRSPPTRRVLALGVERPEHRAFADGVRAEIARSRHDVELHYAPPGERGKFENLNQLLEAHPPGEHDWLLVVDDDIVLPHGFLDHFLFLAERFGLDLAQPAHRRASHAAWRVTRRQPRSVVRETSFVEIGPLTAFARSTFDTLLPFPPLRMGWGLDLHWAALARERGWRCGVVDAVAIGHLAAPAGSAYSREQALAEARAFLRERPYVTASEAQQTLVTHRSW